MNEDEVVEEATDPVEPEEAQPEAPAEPEPAPEPEVEGAPEVVTGEDQAPEPEAAAEEDKTTSDEGEEDASDEEPAKVVMRRSRSVPRRRSVTSASFSAAGHTREYICDGCKEILRTRQRPAACPRCKGTELRKIK